MKPTMSIGTPPGCDASPMPGYLLSSSPCIFSLVPIYTSGWREALWELCLAQAHNTMTQASAQIYLQQYLFRSI